jgi:nicotinamide phosphoribosyltransferase
MENLLLLTDSYKATHAKAYVKGIQNIYSYMESRGGKYEKIIFFGLQYYLKKYLTGIQVTKEKIDEAEAFWAEHFGRTDCFNREGWEHILNVHGGKLPLKIKAVTEGSIIPISNVLMTIENTDPNCYWLTNYVESLLMKLWYPITQTSRSYYIRKDIEEILEKSGTPESIAFRCHDFSYRGVTSEEHAAIGCASHLLSFMGTDTVAGIRMLQKYYSAGMCGFSIPATEHSIMCSFGREHELEACENFLDTYPTGLIACVSDTYNIYECCSDIWGGKLKDKVINRDGTLVVRPDSGSFMEIVPEILEILGDKFGFTVNDKGYKVLDPHVRVIQGDGMNPVTIKQLYDHIMKLGWSADNLTVGSGGGLMMKDIDRDTCKFAIKASAANINGEWIGIQKDPITDKGKKSKKGRLKLIEVVEEPYFETIEESDPYYDQAVDILQTVFENGELLIEYSLDEIKEKLNKA